MLCGDLRCRGAESLPESLQLFLNGILQEPGEQFELAGAQQLLSKKDEQ